MTNYDNSLPKRKTGSRLRGLSEKREEYGLEDLRFGVHGENIGFFFLLDSPRQWGRRWQKGLEVTVAAVRVMCCSQSDVQGCEVMFICRDTVVA